MIEMKVVKIFQIRKIQRVNESVRYLKFDHRMFWSRWKLLEMLFQTTYISMINFQFCTVLIPGASKVDQTHMHDAFLDLAQFYQIWQDSLLIEMNDVNNVIMTNSQRYTVFSLQGFYKFPGVKKYDFVWPIEDENIWLLYILR